MTEVDTLSTRFATPQAALAAQAELRPQAEALAFPEQGERRSFADWRAEAEALARALLARGVAPGSHIALLAENRVEWPIIQLAVAAMGGVLVPLNTHYRRDDLAFALKQSRSRLLFLSPAFRSNAYLEVVRGLRAELPELEALVSLDGEPADCLGYARLLREGAGLSAALPPVGPRDPASLQYTSGTTGFPKGALLTHEGMLVVGAGAAGRLGVAAGDRWTSIIPLFHCAGCIMNLLGCLATGACYVGVAGFDAEAMFRLIERERCSFLTGVPTSYLAMLEHPARRRYDLSSLRGGTCGGADCNPSVLRRCAEAFPMPGLCQVYGQTETSTLIACPAAEDLERWATAGPPLPGVAVRVSDPESGRPLPAGAIGQIEARGPNVMLGYFEQPAATAAVLDSAGWLKTGDLGCLTPEGRVAVGGGRLRDMIIRGGENIYPVEIENLLLEHPAVEEAAVFGEPDPYYGERVAAALRLSTTVEAAALAAFCAGRIARFKVPARFYRVERFPMTASGKIRKVELSALAAAGRLEVLA